MYVIFGECGSGVVCLNGVVVRFVQFGDIIIIIFYVFVVNEEVVYYYLIVVIMNEQNKI